MRKTKIVCTIGPSSESEETMRALLLGGLNVARFNFSHGTHESHGAVMARFRKVRDELGLCAAVMLDTKGPEIRTGSFEVPVTLLAGQKYTLTTKDIPGSGKRCTINYAGLPGDVAPGGTILIDDGEVALSVERVEGCEIHTTVTEGGEIGSHKGVNVPGVQLTFPFLSERDESDLLFGIEQDVDFVAASFVRRAQDISDLRAFLTANGGGRIRIIAKIESAEGVENFEEILSLADGVMIARGDMGVEVPFELLPGIQKRMIRACCREGKDVITATQMLDSMEENHHPTRAEISDVANAVFDGTSAVMLSGETASGRFPVEAVKTMARIAEQAEKDDRSVWTGDDFLADISDNTNALSMAACMLADQTGASAIIVDSSTGKAARRVSKFRPKVPILAQTLDPKVYHQLSLSRGVIPMLSRKTDSVDILFHCAIEEAKSKGYLKPGDTVVFTAGIPLNTPGSTNMAKVQTIE